MKNIMIIQRPIKIIIILIALTVISCEKTTTVNYKDLLGTWVSKDLIDTIEFTSDTSLSKIYYGIPDYYKYKLSEDSITIQYVGKLFIYDFPTTHYFQFNNLGLTIDFLSKGCFEFRRQIINFTRK